MDKYLSDLAKRLTPYVPGEQPKSTDLIKLNTNENPYPPNPKALVAMKKAITENLRLYSPPECEGVRDAIAKIESLPSRDYVYAGNGSDEILAFCFAAFFGGDKPLLFPDVTYSFYPVYCKLFDIKYNEIPLNDSLEINLSEYDGENCGIIFANPNAPTGILVKIDEIISLLSRNTESVVVVDEAYIDFGGESCAKLISKYPNLAVIRTLSKSHSLAGLRCGYLMAAPHLIEGVIRIKNSFNSYTMDTIAQAGMTEAILDDWYKRRQCDNIVATRDSVLRAVKALGFNATDSKSNFIFISHNNMSAENIAAYLRENNVLVRHFKKPERISNYLRITVGTPEQMEILVERLKEYRDMHI